MSFRPADERDLRVAYLICFAFFILAAVALLYYCFFNVVYYLVVLDLFDGLFARLATLAFFLGAFAVGAYGPTRRRLEYVDHRYSNKESNSNVGSEPFWRFVMRQTPNKELFAPEAKKLAIKFIVYFVVSIIGLLILQLLYPTTTAGGRDFGLDNLYEWIFSYSAGLYGMYLCGVLFDLYLGRLDYQLSNWIDTTLERSLPGYTSRTGTWMFSTVLALILLVLIALSLDGGHYSIIPSSATFKDGYIRLEVHDLTYDPPTAVTNVSFEYISPERAKALLNLQEIAIDGQALKLKPSPIEKFRDGTTSVIAEGDLKIESFEGASYWFPLTTYGFAPVITPLSTTIETQGLPYVVAIDSGLLTLGKDHFISNDSLFFFVRYSWFYTVVCAIVIAALSGFLWLILQTKEREELFELSVGIFAALVAIRGFVIPLQLNTPTVIDQLIAIYLLLLIIVLFLKYSQISRSDVRRS